MVNRAIDREELDRICRTLPQADPLREAGLRLIREPDNNSSSTDSDLTPVFNALNQVDSGSLQAWRDTRVACYAPPRVLVTNRYRHFTLAPARNASVFSGTTRVSTYSAPIISRVLREAVFSGLQVIQIGSMPLDQERGNSSRHALTA